MDLDLYNKLDERIWKEPFVYSSIYQKTPTYCPADFSLGTNIPEKMRTMADNYFIAGYFLQEKIIEENTYYFTDALSIPMLFLFRHSIELLLKSRIAKSSITSLRVTTQAAEHKISDLYSISKKEGTQDKNTYEFLKSIDQVDDSSDLFRYPYFCSQNTENISIKSLDMAKICAFYYFSLLKELFNESFLESEAYRGLKNVVDINNNNFLCIGSFLPGETYLVNNNANYTQVIDGFLKAARLLYNEISSNESQSNLKLPACYLFRHSLELAIKDFNVKIHPLYKKEVEKETLQQIKIRIFGHEINKQLFNNCKLIIGKWADENGWETARIDQIQTFVDELGSIDKSSDYFRYPIDKNCNEYSYNIDFCVFSQCVDYVIDTIYNCSHYLEDISDYICEGMDFTDMY